MSALTYDIEHKQFRDTAARFVAEQITPSHENWEQAGQWDRTLFTEAGKNGLIGFEVDETYGGPGVDVGLVGIARQRAATGLDDDVVAELDDLLDGLRGRRDARLTRLRLRGYS